MLSLTECEEISRGLAAGRSTRKIAVSRGRAPYTISREIGCNEGAESYRASQPDHADWGRARRPKPRKRSVYRADTSPCPQDAGKSR